MMLSKNNKMRKNVHISVIDEPLENIEISKDLYKLLIEDPVYGKSDYSDLPGAAQKINHWRSFSNFGRRNLTARPLSSESLELQIQQRKESRLRQLAKREKLRHRKEEKKVKERLRQQERQRQREKMIAIQEAYTNLDSDSRIIISVSPSKRKDRDTYLYEKFRLKLFKSSNEIQEDRKHKKVQEGDNIKLSGKSSTRACMTNLHDKNSLKDGLDNNLGDILDNVSEESSSPFLASSPKKTELKDSPSNASKSEGKKTRVIPEIALADSSTPNFIIRSTRKRKPVNYEELSDDDITEDLSFLFNKVETAKYNEKKDIAKDQITSVVSSNFLETPPLEFGYGHKAQSVHSLVSNEPQPSLSSAVPYSSSDSHHKVSISVDKLKRNSFVVDLDKCLLSPSSTRSNSSPSHSLSSADPFSNNLSWDSLETLSCIPISDATSMQKERISYSSVNTNYNQHYINTVHPTPAMSVTLSNSSQSSAITTSVVNHQTDLLFDQFTLGIPQISFPASLTPSKSMCTSSYQQGSHNDPMMSPTAVLKKDKHQSPACTNITRLVSTLPMFVSPGQRSLFSEFSSSLSNTPPKRDTSQLMIRDNRNLHESNTASNNRNLFLQPLLHQPQNAQVIPTSMYKSLVYPVLQQGLLHNSPQRQANSVGQPLVYPTLQQALSHSNPQRQVNSVDQPLLPSIICSMPNAGYVNDHILSSQPSTSPARIQNSMCPPLQTMSEVQLHVSKTNTASFFSPQIYSSIGNSNLSMPTFTPSILNSNRTDNNLLSSPSNLRPNLLPTSSQRESGLNSQEVQVRLNGKPSYGDYISNSSSDFTLKRTVFSTYFASPNVKCTSDSVGHVASTTGHGVPAILTASHSVKPVAQSALPTASQGVQQVASSTPCQQTAVLSTMPSCNQMVKPVVTSVPCQATWVTIPATSGSVVRQSGVTAPTTCGSIIRQSAATTPSLSVQHLLTPSSYHSAEATTTSTSGTSRIDVPRNLFSNLLEAPFNVKTTNSQVPPTVTSSTLDCLSASVDILSNHFLHNKGTNPISLDLSTSDPQPTTHVSKPHKSSDEKVEKHSLPPDSKPLIIKQEMFTAALTIAMPQLSPHQGLGVSTCSLLLLSPHQAAMPPAITGSNVNISPVKTVLPSSLANTIDIPNNAISVNNSSSSKSLPDSCDNVTNKAVSSLSCTDNPAHTQKTQCVANQEVIESPQKRTCPAQETRPSILPQVAIIIPPPAAHQSNVKKQTPLSAWFMSDSDSDDQLDQLFLNTLQSSGGGDDEVNTNPYTIQISLSDNSNYESKELDLSVVKSEDTGVQGLHLKEIIDLCVENDEMEALNHASISSNQNKDSLPESNESSMCKAAVSLHKSNESLARADIASSEPADSLEINVESLSEQAASNDDVPRDAAHKKGTCGQSTTTSSHLTSRAHQVVTKIALWTKDEVCQWLKEHHLDKICPNLCDLDGNGLQKLALRYMQDPLSFKAKVKNALSLTVFQSLVFSNSMKKLTEVDDFW